MPFGYQVGSKEEPFHPGVVDGRSLGHHVTVEHEGAVLDAYPVSLHGHDSLDHVQIVARILGGDDVTSVGRAEAVRQFLDNDQAPWPQGRDHAVAVDPQWLEREGSNHQ